MLSYARARRRCRTFQAGAPQLRGGVPVVPLPVPPNYLMPRPAGLGRKGVFMPLQQEAQEANRRPSARRGRRRLSCDAPRRPKTVRQRHLGASEPDCDGPALTTPRTWPTPTPGKARPPQAQGRMKKSARERM